MDHLWLKAIHILSATLVLGTGLGIAFFLWTAHRTGDARIVAAVARNVVIGLVALLIAGAFIVIAIWVHLQGLT